MPRNNLAKSWPDIMPDSRQRPSQFFFRLPCQVGQVSGQHLARYTARFLEEFFPQNFFSSVQASLMPDSPTDSRKVHITIETYNFKQILLSYMINHYIYRYIRVFNRLLEVQATRSILIQLGLMLLRSLNKTCL